MQAEKPICPNRKPMEVPVEGGKVYWWCTCGKSKKQPFCDGSHKGTSFVPLKYEPAPGDKTAVLCQCKRTGNKPFCDGTHTNEKLDW